MKKDYYIKKASHMIEDDKKYVQLCQDIDDIIHGNWDLPDELNDKGWMRTVVAPEPAAALNTAVKVLSSELPNLKMMPLVPTDDARSTVNTIEKVLLWEFMSSNKRNEGSIIADMVRSALRYDAIVMNIKYLPYQADSLKTIKNGIKERILSKGKYALDLYNPANVHYQYNSYGLDCVLLAYNTTAGKILDEWGNLAAKVLKGVPENADYTYYDYTDITHRAVWVTPGKDSKTDNTMMILNEDHELPFIPWICKRGGTSLESKTEFKHKPLLENVVRMNIWKTLNVVGSLFTSETISYAASPRGIVNGPGGEFVRIDYGDPNKPIVLKPGQTYQPINPPAIDRALTEIYDRTKAQVDANTSVSVLHNMNFAAGTAYASINALLQTAIASLQPYKKLAETALSEIFEQMLLWLDFTGDSLSAYGKKGKDYGNIYTVTPDMFDPEHIYIDVVLDSSAPTDMLQRINAGAMLIQMGVPKQRVFEQLNISDPEQAIIEKRQELFDDMEVQIAMQERQIGAQAQLQQMLQPQRNPATPPAFDTTRGEGFNPAAGGTPPANAAPQFTREQITGKDNRGNPVGA
jgi:hypothetical protein